MGGTGPTQLQQKHEACCAHIVGFPGLTGSQTNSLHAPQLPAQRLPEVWQKRKAKMAGSIVYAESTLRPLTDTGKAKMAGSMVCAESTLRPLTETPSPLVMHKH